MYDAATVSPRRKSSQEILGELEAPPDGLPVRNVNVWTLEKLAILRLYFDGFTAASKRADGGVYIDGLAGPGMGKVRGAVAPPEYVWGSPLLALRTNPKFQQCHFIEKARGQSSVLRTRIGPYGSRANLIPGDVNRDLAPLLRDSVNPRAPCVCLLDPEGTELDWATVRSAAMTPNRIRKPELLILFPSSWLLRLLPRHGEIDPRHEEILDRMMPSGTWRETYENKLAGIISAARAKEEYVESYRSALEGFGYRALSHVVEAPSKPGQKRRERYRLIFATEHAAGERIMLDVFRRPYVLDYPVSGQTTLFELG